MSKQVMVIGLGQFGTALARALSDNGAEVLAVDLNPAHIHDIAPHVADAVLMDAMDEEALAALAPARRDTCVCAIGDDNREGGIIVTALLKQLGAEHIVARATDDVHARILTLVGADEVLNPERSFGARLAVKLARRHVLNTMPLGGDLVLTELSAPESFWGRNLIELSLPKRFGVTVSAIRRTRDGVVRVELADPAAPLAEGDVLMLVSAEDAIRKLTERS
jgi:trk system potassium uptake protein TrkA